MVDHSETILFCLPFAGSSAYSYRAFQSYTDDTLRIAAIDLPGRGRRFCEPLLRNLNAMADDAYNQFRQRLDGGAYAVYGHSMGSWIAYLLVKRILRDGYPPPRHLFVSGRPSPSVPGKEKDWHLLPRSDFLEILKRFGGTPREVIGNQELMGLFEPVLRADFQALADYTFEKSEPLDVPITVFWSRDENVTRAQALGWQEQTTKAFSLLEFSGGHFFIFRHAAEIVRIFSRAVADVCDTAACHGGL
jgi:surfactin synthase thioesterase subunit